jgi:hypothetical protein
MVSKIFDSIQEFEYNLEIFTKSVETTPLDEGFRPFIELFNQQLAHYREHGSLPSSEIERLEGRVIVVAKDLESNICNAAAVITPLVSGPHSLARLAQESSDKSRRSGLESLSKDYSYIAVRGDGHCLFRSAALGVLCFFNSLLPAVRQDFVDALQYRLAKLSIRIPPEDLQFLQNCFNRIAAGELPITVMLDPVDSDRLMQMMREVAVSYQQPFIKEDPQCTFAQAAAAEAGSVNDYFSAMLKNRCGGDSELVAIASALGLTFLVLDADAIGGGEARGAPTKVFGEQTGDVIPLLFRGDHYDLAVAR